MVSTGVRDAVLLVGLVLVWFLGNFKFGFLLNSSKAQLTQTPAFLVALWGILMVGTALPSAMLAALYVTQRTTDQHASELVKPFDSAAVAYRSTPYFVVFCHLLGVAFTCFAFVVGSVSSVQVKCAAFDCPFSRCTILAHIICRRRKVSLLCIACCPL